MLCEFVTHDDVPLKWTRHPGVELVLEIGSSPPPDTDPTPALKLPAPPAVPSDMADTHPGAVVAWLDPDLTHGERKVVWIEAQRAVGVCERPDGSNNGPEISEFHRITVRDGVPNFGPWLAKQGGHWCCSFACAADIRTRIHGDPGPMLVPRAAGWELERDAKADKTWRPSELAITGAFVPEPGDVATMQRGAIGSGLRHVVTVKRDVPERKGVITIGGNERNKIGPDTFRSYSSLLGFREMVDDTGPRFVGSAPYQGEDVEQEKPDHILDGDNALEGWSHMAPDPWRPGEWRGSRDAPGDGERRPTESWSKGRRPRTVPKASPSPRGRCCRCTANTSLRRAG